MRYKVLVWRDAAGQEADTPVGSFSFYTYNQAHLMCTGWAAAYANSYAMLWDGTVWRTYP